MSVEVSMPGIEEVTGTATKPSNLSETQHELRLGKESRTQSLSAPTTTERKKVVVAHRGTLALVGVVAIFLLLGTFIALKTPAYESADEPGHVENIETLVAGHWYGMSSSCTWISQISEKVAPQLNCSGDEAQQAPLYYLVFAGWQRLVGLPAQAPFKGQLAKNPFLFGVTPHGVWLHHSSADLRYLLWLRLPNVFLGALTVLFTFFALRLVTPDPWTPVVGASIVAFLPRFVFLSSFVTNDNLVDLLGALLVFTALRYVRGPSRWRMALVGVVVGLLVITKLSALPLVIVPVVLSLMASGWRRRAEQLGICLVSIFGVSGWYFVQNAVRYGGDPLARSATARYLSQVVGFGLWPWQKYVVNDPLGLVFVHVPARIFGTFWYQSGWNEFHWSWPTNLIFTVGLCLALAGLVRRHVNRNALISLLAIAIAGILSVWVLAFQTPTYQARYAYVGLPAIAALAALGLERWKLPIRFLFPAVGLCGTLIAIQQNVLAVHWSS
jgi:hypothetical protein